MIHTTTVHLPIIEGVTWTLAFRPVAYSTLWSGRGPVALLALFAGRSPWSVYHAAEIAAFKTQPCADMTCGSGQLIRFLLERVWVDRFALRNSQSAAGTGKRFYSDVPVRLTLCAGRTCSSGVVLTPAHPATR